MRTAVIDEAIDVAAVLREVERHANGAAVLFVGTVREVNDGRAVTGMEYSAYRAMAERELADVAAEAAERVGTSDVVVVHRLGVLGLGDASVAIAVGHPHRGEAFAAARYVIEQLKRRVPIWKLEHYVDGAREWVDPSGGREWGVGSGGSDVANGECGDRSDWSSPPPTPHAPRPTRGAR